MFYKILHNNKILLFYKILQNLRKLFETMIGICIIIAVVSADFGGFIFKFRQNLVQQ